MGDHQGEEEWIMEEWREEGMREDLVQVGLEMEGTSEEGTEEEGWEWRATFNQEWLARSTLEQVRQEEIC